MSCVEIDLHRLAQRQKQVNLGKKTAGYEIYSLLVSKCSRLVEDPKTPDIHRNLSKRQFDGLMKSWRRQLHFWDDRDTAVKRVALRKKSKSQKKRCANGALKHLPTSSPPAQTFPIISGSIPPSKRICAPLIMEHTQNGIHATHHLPTAHDVVMQPAIPTQRLAPNGLNCGSVSSMPPNHGQTWARNGMQTRIRPEISPNFTDVSNIWPPADPQPPSLDASMPVWSPATSPQPIQPLPVASNAEMKYIPARPTGPDRESSHRYQSMRSPVDASMSTAMRLSPEYSGDSFPKRSPPPNSPTYRHPPPGPNSGAPRRYESLRSQIDANVPTDMRLSPEFSGGGYSRRSPQSPGLTQPPYSGQAHLSHPYDETNSSRLPSRESIMQPASHNSNFRAPVAHRGRPEESDRHNNIEYSESNSHDLRPIVERDRYGSRSVRSPPGSPVRSGFPRSPLPGAQLPISSIIDKSSYYAKSSFNFDKSVPHRAPIDRSPPRRAQIGMPSTHRAPIDRSPHRAQIVRSPMRRQPIDRSPMRRQLPPSRPPTGRLPPRRAQIGRSPPRRAPVGRSQIRRQSPPRRPLSPRRPPIGRSPPRRSSRGRPPVGRSPVRRPGVFREDRMGEPSRFRSRPGVDRVRDRPRSREGVRGRRPPRRDYPERISRPIQSQRR
eukprot:109105_1